MPANEIVQGEEQKIPTPGVARVPPQKETIAPAKDVLKTGVIVDQVASYLVPKDDKDGSNMLALDSFAKVNKLFLAKAKEQLLQLPPRTIENLKFYGELAQKSKLLPEVKNKKYSNDRNVDRGAAATLFSCKGAFSLSAGSACWYGLFGAWGSCLPAGGWKVVGYMTAAFFGTACLVCLGTTCCCAYVTVENGCCLEPKEEKLTAEIEVLKEKLTAIEEPQLAQAPRLPRI